MSILSWSPKSAVLFNVPLWKRAPVDLLLQPVLELRIRHGFLSLNAVLPQRDRFRIAFLRPKNQDVGDLAWADRVPDLLVQGLMAVVDLDPHE